MKKIYIPLFLCILLFSCKDKKNYPDVSAINVTVPVVRFDQDFFSIDTNNVSDGLKKVAAAHPDFYLDFMQNILGVSGADTNQNTILVTKEFIRGYTAIYDTLQQVFSNTKPLQKELESAFRFVKYYFPKYKTGKAILFVGPFDAPGVASTYAGIAIGLQQYAGKDFSIYQSAMGQELFPTYISRRFSANYITANSMKAVVEDLFPDKSAGRPLIEQMIEKGKLWYLLDKFLPTTADSIKTGYTSQQLKWCTANEGLIWSYLIKNEDLQSLSPAVLQVYIGEAPFTQGFSQEFSPGNIGQWIGWQIVKKYAAKNPTAKPEDIMTTKATTILNEAKYKPK